MMAPRIKHIDGILRHWPFELGNLSARVVKATENREVLQMRIDLGLMQMEMTGRPDGERPGGAETYLDYLLRESLQHGPDMILTEEQCAEADREFAQFYHRRICWLTLKNYRRAAEDAEHTLSFMDFCQDHSPDEQWSVSREQYRPFVLFHLTQASALAKLEEEDAEAAVQEINEGLQRFRDLFAVYDAEEQYDDDELVSRLVEMREDLRNEFDVGRTLEEQLSDAVAAEEYELAALLRDKLSRRTDQQAPPRLRKRQES
jgi:hypothetical protein